jgi:Polyketide cyclase / dehydrase and lipid transport
MKTLENDLRAYVTLEVEAEPETLWDIIADFKNHSELAGSGEVQGVTVLTPGPVRVGTKAIGDQKIGHLRYKSRIYVIEAERGRVLEWKTGLNETAAPNHWRFEFQRQPDRGDGKTRTLVIHTYRFDPPFRNITSRLLGPVMKPRVKGNAEGMKETLKGLAARALDREAQKVS